MIQKANKKQYAFAIVFFKDSVAKISALIEPYTLSTDNKRHSEEILIKILDYYFQKNGNNVKHVFIYTHYSPCKDRVEECRESCMSLLKRTADQWQNDYGFSTEVVYKESWGVASDYFNHLKYSDIYPKGIVNKCFEQVIEICDNIPFQLKSKYFNKLDPKTFKNKDIQNYLEQLKELANSVGLRKDHLKEGKRIIASLENFQDQNIKIKCQLYRKNFYEMVKNCFMKLFRKTISQKYNTEVDYIIAMHLQQDDKSTFRLYHTQDRYPGCEQKIIKFRVLSKYNLFSYIFKISSKVGPLLFAITQKFRFF